MRKLLLIGDDLVLLQARALILAEWDPLAATSSEAPRILDGQTFELVLIGQSVKAERVAELIQKVRSVSPSTRLLLLRVPGGSQNFDVETFDGLVMNPEWLRGTVAQLLEPHQSHSSHDRKHTATKSPLETA